jgi:putative methionine-R-sulfoxide reductase with GAF domain
MSTNESQFTHPAEEFLHQTDLIEKACMAHSLEEIVELMLPNFAEILQSSSAFIYTADSRLGTPQLFQYRIGPEMSHEIKILFDEQFDVISNQDDLQELQTNSNVKLFPLRTDEMCIGLMGFVESEETIEPSPDLVGRIGDVFVNFISRVSENLETKKELSRLRTYESVSSMLTQCLDLHDLLEITLHYCMEEVSAEAASILLIDHEKKNFSFYHVEGPKKPILMKATFPTDKGIAGDVLDKQQPEIVNDVPGDPRYYSNIDSLSGFKTRNMVAIPLIAGEEKIAVLEILNKADEASFTIDDQLLLLSISDEMSFAIRNAMVFEYVVNSYCLQRQGKATCKGCKRPLGSWTPCVKYQEETIPITIS